MSVSIAAPPHRVTRRAALAGQPFRRVLPREGSMGFVYNFAVVKGAPNRDAAYRFLDALLGTPGIAAALTRSAGCTSSLKDAGAGLTEVERAAYGLDPAALGRLRSGLTLEINALATLTLLAAIAIGAALAWLVRARPAL